jgi:hypothetical protein
MKLNKDFILHTINEETLLVPTGRATFSGIVRGNNTLGQVLEQLKTDTTEEEIVAAIRAQYEAPEGVVENDVRAVLDKLRGIGALDE